MALESGEVWRAEMRREVFLRSVKWVWKGTHLTILARFQWLHCEKPDLVSVWEIVTGSMRNVRMAWFTHTCTHTLTHTHTLTPTHSLKHTYTLTHTHIHTHNSHTHTLTQNSHTMTCICQYIHKYTDRMMLSCVGQGR